MRQVQARLSIAHKSVMNQIRMAEATLVHARSSPNFVPSEPSFQQLETETAALRQADERVAQMRAELKSALAARDGQRVRFRKAAADYVNHISARAKGSPTAILEGGLDLSRSPSPSQEPGTPMIREATAGLLAGELRLRWPRVPGAVSYQIERAFAYEGPYTHVSSHTTCTVRLLGQPTNVELWYRVQATGAGGTGPFCTPVPTLLPQHARALGEGERG